MASSAAAASSSSSHQHVWSNLHSDFHCPITAELFVPDAGHPHEPMIPPHADCLKELKPIDTRGTVACPQCRRPFRPAEARVNTTLVDMMRRLPQLRELVRFGDALLDVDPAQAVHMPVFVFEDHHSPAFRQLVQLMAAHAVFESREFWNPDTVAAAVGGAVGAGSAAWGGVKLLKAAKAGKMAAGAGKALLLPKVALGLGVVGAVLGGGYLLYQLHGQRQERNKRNKIEQELRAAINEAARQRQVEIEQLGAQLEPEEVDAAFAMSHLTLHQLKRQLEARRRELEAQMAAAAAAAGAGPGVAAAADGQAAGAALEPGAGGAGADAVVDDGRPSGAAEPRRSRSCCENCTLL